MRSIDEPVPRSASFSSAGRRREGIDGPALVARHQALKGLGEPVPLRVMRA
jgi:hypothetical protein